MSRFTELAKGTREYLPAFWPANAQLGRPEPIAMRLAVLTDDDFQLSIADAHARLRELKLEIGAYTADELETETSVQVLARACRDAADPDKVSFAVDAEDLRKHTAPWERAEVIDAWRPWQERRNPMRALTVEERQAVEENVKKKDGASLRACGLDLLVGFLLTSESPPST